MHEVVVELCNDLLTRLTEAYVLIKFLHFLTAYFYPFTMILSVFHALYKYQDACLCPIGTYLVYNICN